MAHLSPFFPSLFSGNFGFKIFCKLNSLHTHQRCFSCNSLLLSQKVPHCILLYLEREDHFIEAGQDTAVALSLGLVAIFTFLTIFILLPLSFLLFLPLTLFFVVFLFAFTILTIPPSVVFSFGPFFVSSTFPSFLSNFPTSLLSTVPIFFRLSNVSTSLLLSIFLTFLLLSSFLSYTLLLCLSFDQREDSISKRLLPFIFAQIV